MQYRGHLKRTSLIKTMIEALFLELVLLNCTLAKCRNLKTQFQEAKNLIYPDADFY